jgi:hypothetical protein
MLLQASTGNGFAAAKIIGMVVPETRSSLKTRASLQGVYRKAKQEKLLWNQIRSKAKYGPDRFRFPGLFPDRRRSEPLLEFLDTTDTGRKIEKRSASEEAMNLQRKTNWRR